MPIKFGVRGLRGPAPRARYCSYELGVTRLSIKAAHNDTVPEGLCLAGGGGGGTKPPTTERQA
eukprot:5415113-Prymnesium_polylepis.1